jgi:hypothetical protein
MVSNEAVLHFGIGEAASLSRVEVRWPSGTTQAFEAVASNRRYLLIEGATELEQRHAFPRHRRPRSIKSD